MQPIRLAVLVSGSGSNLQALLDARAADTLDADIVLVASDRADAYGLQRALQHSLPTACLPLPRPADPAKRPAARAAWEAQLAAIVAVFQPDIVLLSGFMRVLSDHFLDRFPKRVINQHPALLPDDSGDLYVTKAGITIPALRGAHTVSEAVRRGLPVTGCTIHYATSRVDDGPVLARAEVPILASDDEDSLHERIKTAERRLVVDVVNRLARS